MASVRARRLAIVGTIGLIVGSFALTAIAPASAQSSEKPKATEIGVTATEIHIAVIADVDNPFAPGLFKGAADGVKAAAAYLNSKEGGGGLAGRKLVVDFIDSKLNPNETRNATINGCENDYALVGTSALFLTSVEDIVNCKDQAGQAVGIPDLSAVTTGIPESCSPMSFSVIGIQIDCTTTTQNPQTYYVNNGTAKWEMTQSKEQLHGPFIVSNDTKDANRGGTVGALGAQKAGIKADGGTTTALSGRDPQSAYTPVVQQMKTDGSNYAWIALAASGALLLRQEAQLQGIDSSKVIWDCASCYGNKVVTQNADAFEGETQPLQFLPFEEASTNKTLAAYLKYVKKVGGTADQFSAYGWTAGLAFADGVNAAVKKDGVNGLTRTNLLAGIKSLTAFDAGGMFARHSYATNRPSACGVTVQFTKGKWVRKFPTKKGTFDCKASNLVTVKANLIGAS